MTLRHSALDRRGFLKLAGLSWLTPVGQLLADQAERSRQPAQSIILLWLGGGPSQLETFDPHPDTRIAGGTKAIATAVPGIQLAQGFEQLADQMGSVALIRSMVSKEGDHERGTYLMKTGYRPDPTVEHPSIGAICCHELPVGRTDIPRHISILTGQWPSRGGFLGGEFDAFQVGDPQGAASRRDAPASRARATWRASRDLEVLERAFARGRRARVDATLHRETLARARVMMSSEQLKAFDVSQEPASVRAEYGDTPFGRGCLAARRLTEVGVRCVEVTLDGWDTHVNNHAFHKCEGQDPRPGLRRASARPETPERARSDDRPLLRRVRPHAQDQPDGRPRPLDERLQPGAGRRRHARRPGDRRDRPRRGQRPGPAGDRRRRARDGAGGTRSQPGQGKHRARHQPADQAEPGKTDPRTAELIRTGRARLRIIFRPLRKGYQRG